MTIQMLFLDVSTHNTVHVIWRSWKRAFHELHCPLKVNKTIPFQHLQTLQKEKSLGKSKRNLLSQIALWRSQYSSTLHRLQIEDPDINPVLQQNLKNERPSRNEQNNYSVATRHYLACGTNSISKIYSCIILAQQHQVVPLNNLSLPKLWWRTFSTCVMIFRNKENNI